MEVRGLLAIASQHKINGQHPRLEVGKANGIVYNDSQSPVHCMGLKVVDYNFHWLFLHTDDNLRVNLDNLLIQLRVQVSPFWYQFGEAAGVETEVLDKLADNCSPQECIVEMFDYWLRKQKELPTWSDIAKILNVINLQPLAAQIEMVYTTGN